MRNFFIHPLGRLQSILDRLEKRYRMNKFVWFSVFILTASIVYPERLAMAGIAAERNLDMATLESDHDDEYVPLVRLSQPIEVQLEYTKLRELYAQVSAYSSTKDQTDATPFVTASGTFVRDGVVASNYFPIGTLLRFPDYSGDKVYRVEDRMNARYTKVIDIWMNERQTAKQFGRRSLRVEVVRPAEI